jgi:hypothetical protein
MNSKKKLISIIAIAMLCGLQAFAQSELTTPMSPLSIRAGTVTETSFEVTWTLYLFGEIGDANAGYLYAWSTNKQDLDDWDPKTFDFANRNNTNVSGVFANTVGNSSWRTLSNLNPGTLYFVKVWAYTQAWPSPHPNNGTSGTLETARFSPPSEISQQTMGIDFANAQVENLGLTAITPNTLTIQWKDSRAAWVQHFELSSTDEIAYAIVWSDQKSTVDGFNATDPDSWENSQGVHIIDKNSPPNCVGTVCDNLTHTITGLTAGAEYHIAVWAGVLGTPVNASKPARLSATLATLDDMDFNLSHIVRVDSSFFNIVFDTISTTTILASATGAHDAVRYLVYTSTDESDLLGNAPNVRIDTFSVERIHPLMRGTLIFGVWNYPGLDISELKSFTTYFFRIQAVVMDTVTKVVSMGAKFTEVGKLTTTGIPVLTRVDAPDFLPITGGGEIVYTFNVPVQIMFDSRDPQIFMTSIEDSPHNVSVTASLNNQDTSKVIVRYTAALRPSTDYKIRWTTNAVNSNIAPPAEGVSMLQHRATEFEHTFTVVALKTGNQFLTFAVNGFDATLVEGIEGNPDTIYHQFADSVDLSKVEVTFTLSEKAMAFWFTQELSSPRNQDFTGDDYITYRVRSEDNVFRTYLIFITNPAPKETGNIFTSFKVNTMDMTIADTMKHEFEHGTVLTNMDVDYTVSPKATVTVNDKPVTPSHTMNFTNDVTYIVTAENGDETMYVVRITVAEETSIGKFKVDMVSIYPNPAFDVLYVEAKGMSQIEIIDMLGRTVLKRAAGNTRERFEISSLNDGLYFVRIAMGDGEAIIARFVKK